MSVSVIFLLQVRKLSHSAASEFGSQYVTPSDSGFVAIRLCQLELSKEAEAEAELGVQAVYLWGG